MERSFTVDLVWEVGRGVVLTRSVELKEDGEWDYEEFDETLSWKKYMRILEEEVFIKV